MARTDELYQRALAATDELSRLADLLDEARKRLDQAEETGSPDEIRRAEEEYERLSSLWDAADERSDRRIDNFIRQKRAN